MAFRTVSFSKDSKYHTLDSARTANDCGDMCGLKCESSVLSTTEGLFERVAPSLSASKCAHRRSRLWLATVLAEATPQSFTSDAIPELQYWLQIVHKARIVASSALKAPDWISGLTRNAIRRPLNSLHLGQNRYLKWETAVCCKRACKEVAIVRFTSANTYHILVK